MAKAAAPAPGRLGRAATQPLASTSGKIAAPLSLRNAPTEPPASLLRLLGKGQNPEAVAKLRAKAKARGTGGGGRGAGDSKKQANLIFMVATKQPAPVGPVGAGARGRGSDSESDGDFDPEVHAHRVAAGAGDPAEAASPTGKKIAGHGEGTPATPPTDSALAAAAPGAAASPVSHSAPHGLATPDTGAVSGQARRGGLGDSPPSVNPRRSLRRAAGGSLPGTPPGGGGEGRPEGSPGASPAPTTPRRARRPARSPAVAPCEGAGEATAGAAESEGSPTRAPAKRPRVTTPAATPEAAAAEAARAGAGVRGAPGPGSPPATGEDGPYSEAFRLDGDEGDDDEMGGRAGAARGGEGAAAPPTKGGTAAVAPERDPYTDAFSLDFGDEPLGSPQRPHPPGDASPEEGRRGAGGSGGKGRKRRPVVRFASQPEVLEFTPDEDSQPAAPPGPSGLVRSRTWGAPASPGLGGSATGLVDAVLYALDGLASTAPGVAASSAAVVAEAVCSRAGRMSLLREDGVMADLMARFAAALGGPAARLGGTPLRLCAAIFVLAATQPEMPPSLLTSEHLVAVAAALFPEDGGGAAATLLPADDPRCDAALAALGSRGLLASRPSAASLRCPAFVAALALRLAMDPHNPLLSNPERQDAVAQLKHALRPSVLRGIALAALGAARGLAADGAGGDWHALPSGVALDVVAGLFALLEHATFALPENAVFMAEARVPGGDGGDPVPFPRALAAVLPVAAPPGVRSVTTRAAGGGAGAAWAPTAAAGEAWDTSHAVAFHALCGLAVNLSHNRPGVCEEMAAAGTVPFCLALLALWSGMLAGAGAGVGGVRRSHVLANAHDINVVLGLLINLAEHSPRACALIADTALSAAAPGTDSGDDVVVCLDGPDAPHAAGPAPGCPAVRMLCGVFGACGAEAEAAAQGRGAGTSADAMEVTLEDLSEAEQSGALAATESYSALLVGVVVDREPGALGQAKQALTGGSLAGVTAAVRKCCEFYSRSGAMERESLVQMQELITRLSRKQAEALLDSLLDD